MTIWLKDKRGNKCSVEYFGSREVAQRALDSLEKCENFASTARAARAARISLDWKTRKICIADLERDGVRKVGVE